MDWKNILNKASPYLKQVIGEVADNFVPSCEECGEMGIPIRCLGCQSFVCLDHAFVNYTSREIVCFSCVESFESGKGKKQRKAQRQKKKTEADYPWTVLGIPPGSSEEVINKAFRRKAAKCHPDKGGKTEDFNKLNDAKDVAIKIIRGT